MRLSFILFLLILNQGCKLNPFASEEETSSLSPTQKSYLEQKLGQDFPQRLPQEEAKCMADANLSNCLGVISAYLFGFGTEKDIFKAKAYLSKMEPATERLSFIDEYTGSPLYGEMSSGLLP